MEMCVEYDIGIVTTNACVDYSGFRLRGGGWEGFLELNISGDWLPACGAFSPTSEYLAAHLACSELFGRTGTPTEQDAATTANYFPLLDCPDGATSLNDCGVILEQSSSFNDFVYVTCE